MYINFWKATHEILIGLAVSEKIFENGGWIDRCWSYTLSPPIHTQHLTALTLATGFVALRKISHAINKRFFNFKKIQNFQLIFLYFSYFCSKHRLWVHVLTSTHNLCFRAKIRKIVLLYKSGVQGGIHYMDMFS